MQKLILSFLLLLTSVSMLAQQAPATLKGQVVADDYLPVMFATVCLFSHEKIVAGGLTDTTGFFSIKGQFNGEYNLQVSSVGYEELSM
nr:carboxypeptidase-like regulatory domain-containing protein [Bacteroidales bacterium]